MTLEPRILPFVLVDRVSVNRDLDQEMVDRERSDAVEEMATKAIDELDLDRIVKGEMDS